MEIHTPVTPVEDLVDPREDPGQPASRARDSSPSTGSRRLVELLWPPPPWQTLAATTTLLALSIATGTVTGIVPVALLSVAWMMSVAYLVVVLLVATKPTWSAYHWVFAVGLGAAALRMCSLGIVQVLENRQSLFWITDWRYHATQAYGIARFGGLSDSLDYAGRPVDYHAGPSWIAGSLHATVGAPVNLVLFVLVPLACVLVIGAGSYRLLRFLGAGRESALVAVAVAVNLPIDPQQFVRRVLDGGVVDYVKVPTVWWFTPSLMLNSLLAIAVGVTAAWMIVGARAGSRVAIGGVCLATLVAIKPQFFFGFLAVLGGGLAVDAWRRRDRRCWYRLFVVIVAAGVAAIVVSVTNPNTTSFDGLEVDLSAIFRRRFVTAQSLLFLAVAVIALAAILATKRRSESPRVLRFALGAAVGVVTLLAFLESTTFLMSASDIAQANAIGVVYVRASFDVDLSQALVPAVFLLTTMAAALLVDLARRSGRLPRYLLLAGAGVMFALTWAFPISAMISPTGSEHLGWSEEKALASLIARVPEKDGVWIASDLADFGPDRLPLHAVNLTSLSEAQFYLSNGYYGGWTQDDVLQRVDQLQRFFSTPWSEWQETFLRRHGIEFVLVRDRCPAAWDQTEFSGRVVGSEGDWTLLEVGAPGRKDASEKRLWPEFTGRPTQGTSECLTGGSGS